MDWNPERDDTQPSRRVRARLADALLSLSSSPPSNNISSASTQQSTISSTSPLATFSQQQEQQAQSSVPSSGAMSSAGASTSTASVGHSGNNISSRPPVANNPRIGPYGRIIRPLPHRTSARQGTRSSQSQQTRRQYTAHRIPRPPIVLNSSSSSSSSSDDGSSQGIPEPAPRRAAADRLPHLQHHMTGQQQQNLSGEEAALLQEYATLSALVSEIIGGVPPPIPRVVGGYPEAPSSSIPFPSAASSSSTLRGSATAAASSTSSAETSRPSRAGGSRRPDGQREIRAGTSIIVQGALYTRTARRGESSDTSSPASASASASAGASSRSAQASSSSSTVPRSRRTSSPSSPSAPQQASTPSSPPAAGPSPTERAHMLNRLLRVAAAATAATIVSRSEGLVPPPAAAPGPGGFGEFVGRNAFGSRAGASTVPGAGVGAQGQSRSSAGGSGSGVAAAAAAFTNRARSSWDGSRSSSTTTPSGSSTGGAAAGLRSLLGGHRRSLQRSMQRSGNSLDLLADSRSSSSGTSSPSSTLASASAETRSLSDVAGSGNSRLPGSWIDAGLDALQSRIGRSSTVRAGGTSGRPTGLRQRLTSLAPWMRASRAVMPPSSSASSSQARGGGPSIARASTEQESLRSGHEDDGEADEGEALTQMLRESLAHPMPSRVQRSRSFASLRTRGAEGTPSASTGSGQAGLNSTGHPSTSAGGNTPSGTNASASAEPILPHGVRVDIRDSAASISAFLDRARAGVESGSGEGQDGAPLQGSFEWFLNTLCTDLEAAMAEMDVEQERVARVEAAVRRGAREARAGVRAEETAEGEGGGGGVDAETSAAEESVAEILRRVFGSGTTSASADPNDPNSVPERRRGDVHNAELSFFRMFCFPRANQAGVSSDSLAPSPSNTHPPAGAASMGVGSEFVLHPDLIPCVVVGVRSMTAADERRYAGDEDGDEGDDDDEEEEVVEEQRPQSPQPPPSLPGAWSWARRFPWRSSSRASSARASSPSP
ncbi:hypothetical protein CF326_g3122, partial [Tilletia indica]